MKRQENYFHKNMPARHLLAGEYAEKIFNKVLRQNRFLKGENHS